MATVAKQRSANQAHGMAAWIPLFGLPSAAIVLGPELPSWIYMWAIAVAVYAGLKWLTFADYAETGGSAPAGALAYLFLWPGMDARSFFNPPRPIDRPAIRQWLFALAKIAGGTALIIVAASLVDGRPTVAAWTGMIGVALLLHFGLFHLLALIWRRAGFGARPIMQVPIQASSVSDYWGKRWNLAFRDLAHTYVFRPTVGRIGVSGATLAVFAASGVIHDVVISIPAGGGYGLPTLYFLIQAAGLLWERSAWGKRLGMRDGLVGRCFCALVVLGPLMLLLHPPFVQRVVVPMLQAFGGMAR